MLIAVIMQTAPAYSHYWILLVFWWMDVRSVLSCWFSPMHLKNPWRMWKSGGTFLAPHRQTKDAVVGRTEASMSSWCNKRNVFVPQLKGLAQLLTANGVFQRYYWCCKIPSSAKKWPVFWLILVPVEISDTRKAWAYFTLPFHSWPLLDF